MLQTTKYIILTRSTDPTRPIQNTYLGSDDYLRARFEEYIMSLLSSVKYAQAFDPKNAFKTETVLEDVIRDEEKGKYRISICVNSYTSSSTESLNCFFSKHLYRKELSDRLWNELGERLEDDE